MAGWDGECDVFPSTCRTTASTLRVSALVCQRQRMMSLGSASTLPLSCVSWVQRSCCSQVGHRPAASQPRVPQCFCCRVDGVRRPCLEIVGFLMLSLVAGFKERSLRGLRLSARCGLVAFALTIEHDRPPYVTPLHLRCERLHVSS
jgi:hypothetical protein